MLLPQGQIYGKKMAFYVPIGCVRVARYCGKMCSCRLSPFGGLAALASQSTLFFLYKNHFYKNVEAEICPKI